MTVRELIMDLWDQSGHASDVYPFLGDNQIPTEIDLNSEGAQYFLRLLSQGQVALANWKKKDKRFLRFGTFYRSVNLQLGVDPDVEFTITRTAINQFEIDPTQANFELDIETFNGSLMSYEGSYYKVMSVVELAPNLWVFNVYSEVPEVLDPITGLPVYPEVLTEVQFAIAKLYIDRNAVPLYTWQVNLPLDAQMIMRIDDVESNTEVLRANNQEELFMTSLGFSVGIPNEYMNLGNEVIFNTALLQKRWYKIEYLRNPAPIVDLDQDLEVPEAFHQALLLWCMWKIALRERQEIHSTNAMRLVEQELERVRDEYDNTFERSKPYGFRVRRR